ncbi:MAG: MarR family transcriptional regulator [Acidobacteriota bacterium]|nr:MarR family transcriptional regulator [Acidobacteriota bacterium]
MAQKRSRAAEDARQILNRIRQLVRSLRTFEKEAQARFGLGAAQMFILHVLGNEPELSLGELAQRTATDQSSASLAVGRLVAEKYVRRLTDAQDGRQVRLSLTKKGRALIRRAPPAAQARIMAGVQEMTARERAQLLALLDRLVAGIGAQDHRVTMLFQESGESRTSPRGRSQPGAAAPKSP